MGATAAHRAPERMADETCTQVWAWMTNKCRRRINEREGYITIEISQKRKEKKKKKRRKRNKREKEEGERFLGNERSWEFTSSDEESFLPRT